MKLDEILTEQVLAFPTKDRKRTVQMDKLRSKSKMYNDDGTKTEHNPNKKFIVADKDGKAIGSFDTYKQAHLAIPSLEMKSGKRGLVVSS